MRLSMSESGDSGRGENSCAVFSLSSEAGVSSARAAPLKISWATFMARVSRDDESFPSLEGS